VSAPAFILAAIEAAISAQRGRHCGGELSFCCPVHEDRHPSARWNPTKQVWYCHACGEGGGWKDLAQRFGIDVPARRDRVIRLGMRARPVSARSPDSSLAAPELAPVERLDRAYRALAVELGLTAVHRAHLLERRALPSFALDGFASLPALNSRTRSRVAERVALACGGGPAALCGVPGFYQAPHGWMLANASAGILVPVPTGARAHRAWASARLPGSRRSRA
jgi:hypothetical protein